MRLDGESAGMDGAFSLRFSTFVLQGYLQVIRDGALVIHPPEHILPHGQTVQQLVGDRRLARHLTANAHILKSCRQHPALEHLIVECRLEIVRPDIFFSLQITLITPRVIDRSKIGVGKLQLDIATDGMLENRIASGLHHGRPITIKLMQIRRLQENRLVRCALQHHLLHGELADLVAIIEQFFVSQLLDHHIERKLRAAVVERECVVEGKAVTYQRRVLLIKRERIEYWH